MGSTIINPRLSLRGGSASLKRRDARKRRFNLCREPIARNENGLEASKDKTGEGSTARRSHESTLDALQDHDVQATAEEVNLSSHCMAAPEDAERQSTGLNKHTSQRFIVFVGKYLLVLVPRSRRRSSLNSRQEIYPTVRPRSLFDSTSQTLRHSPSGTAATRIAVDPKDLRSLNFTTLIA